MNGTQLLVLAASLLTSSPAAPLRAQAPTSPYVRVAQIEIDLGQLEAYRAAAQEVIETSVHVEPGVLALYSVAEQDNPTRVIVFEMYADAEAYKAHLETPHFKTYKAATQDMVKSLKLMDTVPISLAAKADPR